MVLYLDNRALQKAMKAAFRKAADATQFVHDSGKFSSSVLRSILRLMWIEVIQINGRRFWTMVTDRDFKTCTLTKIRVIDCNAMESFSKRELEGAGPDEVEASLGYCFQYGAPYLDYFPYDPENPTTSRATHEDMKHLRASLETDQLLGTLFPITKGSPELSGTNGLIQAMTMVCMESAAKAIYEILLREEGGEEVLRGVLEEGLDCERPDRVVWLMVGSLTNVMFVLYIAGEEASVNYDPKDTFRKEKYKGLRAEIYAWVVKVILVFQVEYPAEYVRAAEIHLHWLDTALKKREHSKGGRAHLAQAIRSIRSPTGMEGNLFPLRPRHKRQRSDPALPGDILAIAAASNPADNDNDMHNKLCSLMNANRSMQREDSRRVATVALINGLMLSYPFMMMKLHVNAMPTSTISPSLVGAGSDHITVQDACGAPYDPPTVHDPGVGYTYAQTPAEYIPPLWWDVWNGPARLLVELQIEGLGPCRSTRSSVVQSCCAERSMFGCSFHGLYSMPIRAIPVTVVATETFGTSGDALIRTLTTHRLHIPSNFARPYKCNSYCSPSWDSLEANIMALFPSRCTRTLPRSKPGNIDLQIRSFVHSSHTMNFGHHDGQRSQALPLARLSCINRRYPVIYESHISFQLPIIILCLASHPRNTYTFRTLFTEMRLMSARLPPIPPSHLTPRLKSNDLPAVDARLGGAPQSLEGMD
ncbi:hypothetical protein NMY22_g16862 [Coprinellus aureogranulatus]|nr:hypothetical protein NMY22_g16862 [Coprinellus aureogranulatus]